MINKLDKIENYITNLEKTITDLSCTMNNLLIEFETFNDRSNTKEIEDISEEIEDINEDINEDIKEDKHNLYDLSNLMVGGGKSIFMPNKEIRSKYVSTGRLVKMDGQYIGNLKPISSKY